MKTFDGGDLNDQCNFLCDLLPDFVLQDFEVSTLRITKAQHIQRLEPLWCRALLQDCCDMCCDGMKRSSLLHDDGRSPGALLLSLL